MIASPMPESLKDKEKFFVEEVSRADELHNKPGEQNQVEAAIAFYRALSVYPSPTDLLKIYDQSIKQPVLDMLRMLIVMEPPPSLVAALGAAATAGAAGAAGAEAAGGEDVE
uniref:ARAD1C29524p n=1 Tax=Blastobotrys adeninivorans TaxID=409370 RepID=A0A060T8K7_BLAAD